MENRQEIKNIGCIRKVEPIEKHNIINGIKAHCAIRQSIFHLTFSNTPLLYLDFFGALSGDVDSLIQSKHKKRHTF
jgi:hypothetical protein